MKYSKRILICLLCLVVLLLLPVAKPASTEYRSGDMSSAEEKTYSPLDQKEWGEDQDKLFKFMLDGYFNKIRFSMSEGKVLTNENIIGLPWFQNFRGALKKFGQRLVKSENKFGHIPEYWQMLSQIKREDSGFDWINDKHGTFFGDPFAGLWGYCKANPELLQRSLEIDPDNANVIWVLGMIELTRNFHDIPSVREPVDTEYKTEYFKALRKVYSDAGVMDPENAFYPMYEAVYSHILGDTDSMMKSLARASNCEFWEIPRLFPSNYAIPLHRNFEQKMAPFDHISPGGRFYLLLNFYVGADEQPNFIILREMFNDVASNSADENWRDDLTILQRCACKMGKSVYSDTIVSLVARTYIRICLTSAHTHALEESDIDTVNTVNIALARLDIPKITAHPSMRGDNSHMRFPHSIMMDELNPISRSLAGWIWSKYVGNKTISRFNPAPLDYSLDVSIREKYVVPVFEELEVLDYRDPGAYYKLWLKESIPDIYNPEYIKE